MAHTKYGSGEYSPTPSHCLPSFVNGVPTGFMCLKCGHMQKELDPIFDDLCPVCLKDWALRQGVSRLIPTAEAIEQEHALIPTVTVENPKCPPQRSRSDATTVILNFNSKPK